VARLERTIRAEEEAGRHAIAEVQAEGRRVVAEAQARHRQLSGDLQRFGRAGRVPFGVPAVDYHGWEGTVHTFAFGNPKYAEAFKQANADKRIV
jgi:hypothetical protein